MSRSRVTIVLCAAILCLSTFALSWPLVRSNNRYFYHEDDAHHFNHTVEMAQRRELHPHYFNKPALHFYLRIPLVYASVAWERLHGRIGSIKDIRTRDPFGIAEYAFTPSHPAILSWNRLLSVFWSALLAVTTFAILLRLRVPLWAAMLGGFIPIMSPEVLRNSYIIGVDTLMALTCALCAAYTLWVAPRISTRALLISAVLAGLACASKYNAAPIALVPVTIWWLRDRSPHGFLAIALGGIVGFLLGAPYSLLAFDEFWRGISYEAWHYGVAGHGEHSAPRGLPQARFYLRWLLSDGVGFGFAIFSLLGIRALWKENRDACLILLSFPVAYAALMIAQKTNFTRNMVAIVPFVAVFSAYGISSLALKSRAGWSRLHLVLAACLAISFASQARRSLLITSQAQTLHDTRDDALTWIRADRAQDRDVAIAGELQFPISVFSTPGVDSWNPNKTPIASMIQSGYSYFIVPTGAAYHTAQFVEIERSIPGAPGPQRVPNNPALTILRVPDESIDSLDPSSLPTVSFEARDTSLIPTCSNAREDHCWIQSRLSQLEIPALSTPAVIQVMSPWDEQEIEIRDESGKLIVFLKLPRANEWMAISIPPQTPPSPHSPTLRVRRVHAPSSRGLNTDTRRLGIALKR